MVCADESRPHCLRGIPSRVPSAREDSQCSQTRREWEPYALEWERYQEEVRLLAEIQNLVDGITDAVGPYLLHLAGAFAIAFGVGSREIAARELDGWTCPPWRSISGLEIRQHFQGTPILVMLGGDQDNPRGR